MKTGESVMNAYYYTFGTDPVFPYRRGWVKIYARTRKEADQKFRAKYPNRPGHEGTLNCASIYTQDQWDKIAPEKNWPKNWVMCWAVIE